MWCAKAGSRVKQRQGMCWEGVEKRKFSRNELYDMETHRTSFIIWATNDILPSPVNLKQWYNGSVQQAWSMSWWAARQAWHKAVTPGNTISCWSALQLPWRPGEHPSAPDLLSHPTAAIQFFSAGATLNKVLTSKPHNSKLGWARDWKLLVDLNQQQCFPAEITTTNLRPDLMLWSSSLPTGGRSITRLLKDMGVQGQAQQQAIKTLSSAAEQATSGFGSRWETSPRPQQNSHSNRVSRGS